MIRSETDKGLIVLMDDRFIQPSFAKSMPQDWFDESPRESVSVQIIQDITQFWSSQSEAPFPAELTISTDSAPTHNSL